MKKERTLQEKLLLIEKTAFIAFFVIAIFGGICFGYITSEIKNYSGIKNLRKFQPSIPTSLYDVNGDLIAELFQEKRELAAFDELPSCLVNAFLATEDNNFYDHFGISPMAIFRAMGKNIIASATNLRPTIVQGGSTITQQLAKRLFTQSERTLMRKAFEAVLALQIEKKFSKEEILEMYFNQIYLGHGCHGISTAANFYFNKDVRGLNLIESSVLAALPAKPNGHSPIKFPLLAAEKNRDILNRMVDDGYISKKRADEMYATFWPALFESIKTEFPTKTALSNNIDDAPYFTDYVRQILISRFGPEVVYNEGLKVYTTLNLKRQKIAEKYLAEGVVSQNETSGKANAFYNSSVDRGLIGSYETLRMIFSLPGIEVKDDIESQFKKTMVDEVVDSADILSLFVDAPKTNHTFETFRELISGISSNLQVQGAFIAIEPKSGYLTAMVGGSEFNPGNQYNRAVQARRQPGSSFKPFVYGAGFESRKINGGTALPDAPIVDIDAEGDTWSPGNYEGDFTGLVRISRALAASINIISVRIYDLVGPEGVIQFASRMLKVPESRFTPGPSLALGTTEFTPFEMANAYAIYANRGRDVIPFAIRYVVDRDGNTMANVEEEAGSAIAAKEMNGTIQVIGEDVAWAMTNLMIGVVDHGTAADSVRNIAKFTQKAAGKTGTTSNWTDAWFCGFTPDIAAVTWIGYDRPFMSLGKHQAGASVAAPIWANFMREIYNGMPEPEFPPMPKGVYFGGVCRYTGLIPGPGCKEIASEVMLEESGPTKTCDGDHFEMKSVLDRYMEKEGVSKSE